MFKQFVNGQTEVYTLYQLFSQSQNNLKNQTWYN
jgi:hypothetical protein